MFLLNSERVYKCFGSLLLLEHNNKMKTKKEILVIVPIDCKKSQIRAIVKRANKRK